MYVKTESRNLYFHNIKLNNFNHNIINIFVYDRLLLILS